MFKEFLTGYVSNILCGHFYFAGDYLYDTIKVAIEYNKDKGNPWRFVKTLSKTFKQSQSMETKVFSKIVYDYVIPVITGLLQSIIG